jgi:RNA polymerase sigma factor for flagellar operon FliA
MIENQQRDALIEEYYPLVDKVIKRIRHKIPLHVSYADLHGPGVMGLLDAIKKYDESKKEQFYFYIQRKIGWFIQDELRSLDFISRKTRSHERKIKNIINDFHAENNRSPTIEELAEKLKIEVKECRRLLSQIDIPKFISLNQDVNTAFDKGASFNDIILDESEIERKSKKEEEGFHDIVRKSLSCLDEQEKFVIKSLYYTEGAKMNSIAEEMGMSGSRICQINRSAINKIRSFLKKKNSRDLSLPNSRY